MVPVFQIQVPDAQQVREMDRLYGRLRLLAAPHKRAVAAKKFSRFGYQEPAMTADGRRERDAGSLAENEFRLSLVVVDGAGSFCIVEGVFLAAGDRMEDGTQILKIESHRVLIARHRKKRRSSGPAPGDPSSDAFQAAPVEDASGRIDGEVAETAVGGQTPCIRGRAAGGVEGRHIGAVHCAAGDGCRGNRQRRWAGAG
jgi:hypothetical protein